MQKKKARASEYTTGNYTGMPDLNETRKIYDRVKKTRIISIS